MRSASTLARARSPNRPTRVQLPSRRPAERLARASRPVVVRSQPAEVRGCERARLVRALSAPVGEALLAVERALERHILRVDPMVAVVAARVASIRRQMCELDRARGSVTSGEQGLIPALAQHVRMLADEGLAIVVDEQGPRGPLSGELAAFALRAARELMCNLVKHARATRARIGVSWGPNALKLVVADDGVGIRGSTPWCDGGLGLFDMREQLAAIGGRLEITSSVGAGTEIGLEIPYASAAPPSTTDPRAPLAEELERRQLARDLHDTIGQCLPALKLELETLSARLEAPALAAAAAQLGAVHRQVRTLTFELYPTMLDDLGLLSSLQHYARRLAEEGLTVTVNEIGPRRPLSFARAILAFRAATEILREVVEHARAGEAMLCLSWGADTLRLAVRDDGIGLGRSHERALGRARIRECMACMGGRFHCEPSEGAGSLYCVDIPLVGGDHPN